MAMPAPSDRAELAHAAYIDAMRTHQPTGHAAAWTISGDHARGLHASQVDSRLLDIISRRLQAVGRSYYTIGSSGHEANSLVALATSPTDTAFLHYRSGPFFLQRARQAAGDRYDDFVRDVMRSFAAKAAEPISGGRHKVWGSVELGIPPQTSTIASHLPKAVGYAYALATGGGAGRIAIASFGDASANHSSALSAFNTAAWLRHQGLPLPMLFVCEDNGIGISVRTPPGWLEERWGTQPHITYLSADGNDVATATRVVAEAVHRCRERRETVFLHLRTRRLFGHAGSDVESGYHTLAQIAAVEADDPLVAFGRHLVDAGHATGAELADHYLTREAALTALAEEVHREDPLRTREQVRASVRPLDAQTLDQQLEAFTRSCAERGSPTARAPKHLGTLVNLALEELMQCYPQMTIFGEDVARKGGVYGLTKRLHRTYGAARVFDTLLDEQAILGLAQGMGLAGGLPCPEIQYLAYLHNALDQLRGEASTTQFFSDGQFSTPMLVRVQGYGYQKGFGGHFHNDNSITALRDIPGMIVATPSRGDTAVRLLRTGMALCASQGSVVVCVEPIALYPERDLYESGDDLWTSEYPTAGDALLFGEGVTYEPEADAGPPQVTVLSYANGVRMSLRALRAAGVRGRVLDLCWLQPLPMEWILRTVDPEAPIVIADECRRTGSLSEELMARLVEGGFRDVRRVTSDDSYIPLGDAANLVLLSEAEITDAVQAAAARRASTPATA